MKENDDSMMCMQLITATIASSIIPRHNSVTSVRRYPNIAIRFVLTAPDTECLTIRLNQVYPVL